MHPNKILFFDMDDTIARYNFSTKQPLEDMYKPGFFLNLKPHTLIHEVNRLAGIDPYNIFILSACITELSRQEKIMWVKKWLPNVLEECILLVNVGDNKAQFIKDEWACDFEKDFILIDDYSKNIYEWEMAGGTAIKRINSFNDKKGLNYKYKFKTVNQFRKVLEQIGKDHNDTIDNDAEEDY